MSPDRLKQDPIVQVMSLLDRTRKWLVILAILLALSIVTNLLLTILLLEG